MNFQIPEGGKAYLVQDGNQTRLVFTANKESDDKFKKKLREARVKIDNDDDPVSFGSEQFQSMLNSQVDSPTTNKNPSVFFEDLDNPSSFSRPNVSKNKPNEDDDCDDEEFVMLMMNHFNIVTREEKVEMSEFSYPVNNGRVEEWSGLDNVWYFEIKALPSDLLINEVDKEIIRNVNGAEKLKASDLRAGRCYLVCGFSYENNPYEDPEFVQKMEDENVNNIGVKKLQSQRSNLEKQLPRNPIYEKFVLITGTSIFEAPHYFDKSKALLQSLSKDPTPSLLMKTAIIEYFKTHPIVPFKYAQSYDAEVTEERNKMIQSMYQKMGRKVIPVTTDIDDNIIVNTLKVKEKNNIGHLSALLLVAAKNGQYSRLKELSSYENINMLFTDEYGRSVLHYAGCVGNKLMMEFLFNEKIKSNVELIKTFINKRDNNGNTPLRFACVKNSYDAVKIIVEYMIKHKINLNQCEDSEPLLTISTKHNNIDIAKLLLKFTNLKWTTNVGYPALLFAVSNQNFDMVKMLLQRDPKSPNTIAKDPSAFKESPLILGAHKSGFNGIRILNALLDAGANTEFQNNEGATALICSIRAGNVEGAITLVKRGTIKSLFKSTLEGDTAFESALRMGFGNIANMINEKLKNPNLNKSIGSDGKNEKVIYSFEFFNNLLIADKFDAFKENMIESRDGFDVNTKEEETGHTLLMKSIQMKRNKFSNFIIDTNWEKHGKKTRLNLLSKDIFGRSALFYAKLCNAMELYQVILMLIKSNTNDPYALQGEYSLDNENRSIMNMQAAFIVNRILPYYKMHTLGRELSLNVRKYLIHGKNVFHLKIVIDNIQKASDIFECSQRYKILKMKLPSMKLSNVETLPIIMNYSFIEKSMRINYDTPTVTPLNKKNIPPNEYRGGQTMDEDDNEDDSESEFTVILKRLDRLFLLSSSLSMLHHLGIYHNNLRLTNVLNASKRGINIIGFGCKIIYDRFKQDDKLIAPEFFQIYKSNEELTKKMLNSPYLDVFAFTQIMMRIMFGTYIDLSGKKRSQVRTVSCLEPLVLLAQQVFMAKSPQMRPTMRLIADQLEQCSYDFVQYIITQMKESIHKMKSSNKGNMKVPMMMQLMSMYNGAKTMAEVYENKVKLYEEMQVELPKRFRKVKQELYKFAHKEKLSEITFGINLKVHKKKFEFAFKKLKKGLEVCKGGYIKEGNTVTNSHCDFIREFILKNDNKDKNIKKKGEEAFDVFKDPKVHLMFENLSTLLNLALKKQKLFRFPLLDIIRMLTYVSEHFTIRLLTFESSRCAYKIMKLIDAFSIKDKEENIVLLGWRLMLIRTLCNMMKYEEGRNWIFENNRFLRIEKMVIHGLDLSTTLTKASAIMVCGAVRMSATAFIQNLAIYAHMYRGRISKFKHNQMQLGGLLKSAWTYLIQKVKAFKYKEQNAESQMNIITRLLKGLYKFLKHETLFCGAIQRFAKEDSNFSMINFFKMILLISEKIRKKKKVEKSQKKKKKENEEEKEKEESYKVFNTRILSLSAMLLNNVDFEKMKICIRKFNRKMEKEEGNEEDYPHTPLSALGTPIDPSKIFGD